LHSGATEWRSEGELRRLNLDLGAELDHAIRRNVEVIHDVAGVARHGGKEALPPKPPGGLTHPPQPLEPGFHWHAIHHRGAKVGDLTNCVWSYRLQRNIGFGLVSIDCAAGDRVEVHRHGQALSASLCALPFL